MRFDKAYTPVLKELVWDCAVSESPFAEPQEREFSVRYAGAQGRGRCGNEQDAGAAPVSFPARSSLEVCVSACFDRRQRELVVVASGCAAVLLAGT